MSRFLNGLSNFQMNSRVRADGMSANDLQRKLNRIVPPQPVPQPLSVAPPQPVPQPLPVTPPQPVPQPPPFAGQGAFTSMDPNQNGPVDGAGEYMLAMSEPYIDDRGSDFFSQQNDPAFSQELAKLQSAFDKRFDEMPSGPALTAKAPQQQFAEGYGPQAQMASPQQQMFSQMQNRDFSSPQPQMGPPPQQQIQPAPQQQMAGGYGLTGSYQGDQFSRGVMSLPQIQDNFYSPPAGGYTAPPITSPYSMF